MSPADASAPPRRVAAPGWRVFAPPAPEGGEGGGTARALRGALREAARWSEARYSPRRRPAPPTPFGLGAEPEIWAPLAVVSLLATGAGETDVPRLVHALLRVARWAEGRGAPRVAFAFAREAARASPSHPGAAREAGALLRKRGRLHDAEEWLGEAMARAARLRDREAQRRVAAEIARLDAAWRGR